MLWARIGDALDGRIDDWTAVETAPVARLCPSTEGELLIPEYRGEITTFPDSRAGMASGEVFVIARPEIMFPACASAPKSPVRARWSHQQLVFCQRRNIAGTQP